MKLIKENIENVEYLTEDVGNTKQRYITGIFMQSEKKNRNGRVYPRELLEREVNRYNTNYIRTNRAFGELGHPDTPAIDPNNISHLITELYPDGTDFIGKAKVLDTPKGKIIQNIMDGGGQLGVSTRGVGSLKPYNGVQLVQPDFYLACVDVVVDPSAPDAFVQGIMEDKEWVLLNGNWTDEHQEKAKKVIKEATTQEIEGVALTLFTNYLSKLKKL